MPWELTGNAGTNPAINFVGTTDNEPLVIKTNGGEALRIDAQGHVGIGTPNPVSALHVQGHFTLDPQGTGANDPILFTGTGPGELNRYLELINSLEPNARSASGIKAGGVLVADDYAFENPGKNDLVVKGGAKVYGELIVPGGDCAEDFDASESAEVEPGDVVVINDDGLLESCRHAYDKRVAGVIAGAGNLRPGIILDRQPERANRNPVALLGKAYCKVDAGYGPIEVGDLLVSSPTLAHAMKAGDPALAFGAVIGKALRALESGRGLVPMLVCLR